MKQMDHTKSGVEEVLTTAAAGAAAGAGAGAAPSAAGTGAFFAFFACSRVRGMFITQITRC